MIILDTDHLTILRRASGNESTALAGRMAASADQHVVTTAVTLEEQMSGWLAVIRKSKDVSRQIQG